MPRSSFEDESHYHQLFIDSIAACPAELKLSPDNHVFVWGHELTIFDSGKRGGWGSADIMIVDEDGLVWLIEVKVSNNPELNANIWQDQLFRYRDKLMLMQWDAIHNYTRDFIRGHEKGLPSAHIRDHLANSSDLVDALSLWQKAIGRAKHEPTVLRDKIASSLKRGDYGIAVLADSYDSSISRRGELIAHEGPLAYIIGIPNDDQSLDLAVKWIKNAHVPGRVIPYEHHFQKTYAAYQAELRKMKCTCSDELEGKLCEGAKRLWLDVLMPGLVKMGWKGTINCKNTKGFQVSLPTGSTELICVNVGWSDMIITTLDRQYKLDGSYGMKVNWTPWWLTRWGKEPHLEFVNKWAARFYAIGWRGKGTEGIYAGIRPLTMREYLKWGQEMKYQPRHDAEDFIGRPGEEDVLRQFLAVVSEFLADVATLKRDQ